MASRLSAFRLLSFSGFLASLASLASWLSACSLLSCWVSASRLPLILGFLAFWILGFSPTLCAFVKAVHVCGNKACPQHVCSRGRLWGSFRLQKGGAPPNPPAFLFKPSMRQYSHVNTIGLFKAIHACNKQQASCHHHVCSKGRLCRSCCFLFPPHDPLPVGF